jgi:hypothetical protein
MTTQEKLSKEIRVLIPYATIIIIGDDSFWSIRIDCERPKNDLVEKISKVIESLIPGAAYSVDFHFIKIPSLIDAHWSWN